MASRRDDGESSGDVGGPGETVHMPTVTDLLDFERRHEKHTSRKEVFILDELGVTPARHYQLLLHAARSIEAWEMDPMLCDRVLRRSDRAA